MPKKSNPKKIYYKLSYFFDFEFNGSYYPSGSPLNGETNIDIQMYQSIANFTDVNEVYFSNPELLAARQQFEERKDTALDLMERKNIRYSFW
jgi:hypothetical protein